MRVEFNTMPPDARLWIFAAERQLGQDEAQRLLESVDAFLDDWKAHGHPLRAARELRYGQFLLVAVDEAATGASGCSIDAMVRSLSALERELGIELVNHTPVLYRTDDRVQRVGRTEFAERARRGEVSPDTTVFDNTLTRVAELQEGRWETAARHSWHARAFFASQLVQK
jgi:hypothetical protein